MEKTAITIAVSDQALREAIELVRVEKEWNPDTGRFEYEPIYEFCTFMGFEVVESDVEYIDDLFVRDYVEEGQ